MGWLQGADVVASFKRPFDKRRTCTLKDTDPGLRHSHRIHSQKKQNKPVPSEDSNKDHMITRIRLFIKLELYFYTNVRLAYIIFTPPPQPRSVSPLLR